MLWLLWNNSQWVDKWRHSDTLSCFRVNQYLLLLHNVVCLAGGRKYNMLTPSLVDRGLKPRSCQNPKTIRLVLVASLPGTQHYGVRVNTGLIEVCFRVEYDNVILHHLSIFRLPFEKNCEDIRPNTFMLHLRW
jgi:hypothetical protein